MTRYSVQSRECCGFLFFAKDMGKNIGKSIKKNLSDKYVPGMLTMRQKQLDHAKKPAEDALRTSLKRVILKKQ